MLVCYPIEATHENWLHDSLVSMIHEIHKRLDSGQSIRKTKALLVELIPRALNDVRRRQLLNSSGIDKRLIAYKDSVVLKTVIEREKIFSVLKSQNQVAELLAGDGKLETIATDFPDTHQAVCDLFVFCFVKLTDFDIRKRQYQIIYDNLPTKICPFCGIDRLMDPEDVAQDQDHYLAKSVYPFAAANMRNLVPMCRCCNRDYKKAIDILRDLNGVRRSVFDPYRCEPPKISLKNSVIDPNASLPMPTWDIAFDPPSQHAETWDSVFGIRKRYNRDILGPYYKNWLDGFKKKCSKGRQRGELGVGLSPQEIRRVLANYVLDKKESPNIGNAGFLEPLVFDFLLSLYDQGNERIIQLIRDLARKIHQKDIGPV